MASHLQEYTSGPGPGPPLVLLTSSKLEVDNQRYCCHQIIDRSQMAEDPGGGTFRESPVRCCQ
jgi:hypothetical protein